MERTSKKMQNLPLNQRVITFLEESGIQNLFPPQQSAFETGVLQGHNLVLAAPTSSGKTLVAEVCMMKSILDRGGKALYLVPLRSLAREKYLDFRKYEKLGITTAMSVGDYDSSGTRLADADIIVLTTERADSLIRHRSEWLSEVALLVADEIHLVNDSSRGPTLEMVLANMRKLVPNLQIVALSATISNAEQIAQWLDADLVKSDWRPVPLKEGVLLDDIIHFNDGSMRSIRRRRREEVEDLVLDILNEQGQVLVFVSSRRSAVSIAKRLAPLVRPSLSQDERAQLSSYSKKIDAGQTAPTSSRLLVELIGQGTAFHHAGLSNQERTVIEDCFRERLIKTVVATPTLAAGVNLPARRAIIRDYRRFEEDSGNRPIPVLEYKQMAGRAGRPLYDSYGEAVLIARTPDELDSLTEHYTSSESESIVSKLASPIALRFHLLAAIATGMTCTRDEIDSLLRGTFYSVQFTQGRIRKRISTAMKFLERYGLIETDTEGRLNATILGQRASRLYIDPRTAVIFQKKIPDNESVSVLGLLHLICHTPDQPCSYVNQSELEEYVYFIETHKDDLLVTPPRNESSRKYHRFLGEIKTANILKDWVSEVSEHDITENYNVGMGDVHRYVESAEWLAFSASEIARAMGIVKPMKTLSELRVRLRYGVRSDILELVSLKGIGRVRGRMLHSHGYTTLAALHAAPVERIAQVPSVGTSVAISVKKQLGFEIDGEHSVQSFGNSEPEASDTHQTLLDDFNEH